MRYLNDEEIDIACRRLYLDNALIVLERDLKELSGGPFKIKEPYIELIERAMAAGIEERRLLKKEFLNRKMKIELDEKGENFTKFVFYAGRRSETRSYFKPTLQQHVRRAIEGLFDRIRG